MGIVVLLEDEKIVQEGFKSMIEDIDLNMELLICKNISEYEELQKDSKLSLSIRVLIFDLANNVKEIESKNFKAKDYIDENYKKNRVPIFIHSGYLTELEDYENFGTIFKIEKSGSSIETICNKIKFFNDTGFLEIFCINGILENKLFGFLHDSFVNQFKGDEIELILKSINSKETEDPIGRTLEVFERIALRAVFENLSHEKKAKNNDIEEIQLNAIEHYFRRTTRYKYWTGDILSNKEIGELSILLTPRCNISNNNYDKFLLCKIIKFTTEEIKEFNPACS